jgi:hypothetical protein
MCTFNNGSPAAPGRLVAPVPAGGRAGFAAGALTASDWLACIAHLGLGLSPELWLLRGPDEPLRDGHAVAVGAPEAAAVIDNSALAIREGHRSQQREAA